MTGNVSKTSTSTMKFLNNPNNMNYTSRTNDRGNYSDKTPAVDFASYYNQKNGFAAVFNSLLQIFIVFRAIHFQI